jgi:hypothetical protein
VATEALAKQLEKLAVQTRDNKTGFEKEFELLKFEDETHNKVEKCSVAQRNPDRNRYKDILPCMLLALLYSSFLCCSAACLLGCVTPPTGQPYSIYR